jgi:probable rRNA maturation factor
MSVTIDLNCEGEIRLPYRKLSKRRILSITRMGCDALLLSEVSLSIVLTDNSGIKKINRKYRKKNSPTDVISFAYRENDMPTSRRFKEHLGDIFISVEKAEIQAEEQGVSFEEEMTRLIVHALCHCVGYDHERSRKDEKIMRKREDQIMTYILPR